jgi:hypothetical protein
MATQCPSNSIDSNVAGLRYAEEVCLKVLPNPDPPFNDPHGPIWYPLDPNSFTDFGGQLTTVARNPINPSRQRRKGVVTDLDASGGINQDLTQTNLLRLFQGFVFASWRQKGTTTPYNTAAVAITAVDGTDKTYATTAVAQFKSGNVVAASGFVAAANNGIKHVTASASGEVTVSEVLADEASPPAAAALRVVGHKFAAADMSIVLNGALARLTTVAADFTTMGLIPGEWIYLGSDAAGGRWDVSNGFARIGVVSAKYLEFDKTDWVPQAEAGAGKTIEIYFGDVLKNEDDPALIVRRSYDLERTLGNDTVGPMSEHIIGAVPNQLTLNMKQADKITADLTFVACSHEQRDGTDGLADGDRPSLAPEDAFNTSSDFSRIKLASVSETNSAPTPLFAFATDLTLTVNNNVSGAKALGVLGSFDTDVGTFEVGGSITAYFADMAGVRAVRNNADITLDIAIVKHNAGLVFDVPLLGLGNGRLAVEQNKKITLPLDISAAESEFGHTLLIQSFGYLPNFASPN